MSLWIYPPQIIDTQTGESLFEFSDKNWSMDYSTWETDVTVRIGLRKYPGDRRRSGLVIRINCGQKTAEIDGNEFPVDHLESKLEAMLDAG